MNDPLTQKKQNNTKPICIIPLSSENSLVSVAMSTNTKHSYKLSVKKATRRTRRRKQQQQPQKRRTCTSIEGKCKSKLSQKLQALKSLIPTHNGDTVKPAQLFKETADYIVLLRTRVVILQKLIEYYGHNPENENAVLL